MEWRFPHRVRYEADARSIDEVVATLLAQKRLLEEASALLGELTGIEVEEVQIRVVEVSAGSLFTEIVVQIYGAYQEQIEDKVIQGIENMFGVDVPEELEPLVTLLALAVTYFVARFAYDAIRFKKHDRPASTHIEGDYNIVVNNIASKLNMDSERVEGLLEGRLTRTKSRRLLKSVTDFFGPSRRQRGTNITVDGHGVIEPETIAEYPSDADLTEIDDKSNLDLPNAAIEIRATDKDRSKTGWAARIISDSRFPKRLPMDLYPTVDAEELAALDELRADLILEGETRSDGTFQPKRIHLLRRLPDDAGGGSEASEDDD